MRRKLSIAVALAALAAVSMAKAEETSSTTPAMVIGGWADALGRSFYWEMPSSYDLQIDPPTGIPTPKTSAEFKQAIRALNEHMQETTPMDIRAKHTMMVVCVRDNYIAIRANNAPTTRCPEASPDEIKEAAPAIRRHIGP